MKHGKRVLAALLVLLCMVTLLPPVMALAANRQYTVRFFQGNKGTISGSTVQTVSAGGHARCNTGGWLLCEGLCRGR